jgi:UTP--glucose-1-phosphate uridylyltransferase
MYERIRTAIIPAGGMGTRLLPLTRAVPKELLPVWKRPVLDYAVEEAAEAGIERLIIVTAPGKESLQRHFADSKSHGLRQIDFVMQKTALGLGDAIRRAAPRGEAVAVLLPDELLYGANCLKQLIACRARAGGSVIAVQKVPRSEVSRYGIVDVALPLGPDLRIKGLIEKPQPAAAPSDLAAIGRYVLDSTVIDALQDAQPTVKGEVQLTDSIAATCRGAGVAAVKYNGRRFDCGNFQGLLDANLALAQLDGATPDVDIAAAVLEQEAHVA